MVTLRIAVIGSGVSGLVAARLLAREHEVTVFEADSRIGGHVNTVTVDLEGEPAVHHVDTGFIVYNERNYPNFTRILADLQVDTSPTSMSFSVRCDRTGLEYNGTSLNGLFAQRRNLVRPSFYRLLREILRFCREGQGDLSSVNDAQTVAEYLQEREYSPQFSEQYLLPMGAAIWSCPCDAFADFPIRFILEFFHNHGLLSLRDRPTWRVIDGGSQQYVKRLVAPIVDRVHISCPVHSVTRTATGVSVEYDSGNQEFDEVVFACHSDQALRMLADADPLEQEVLSAFPYSSNTAVLHYDEQMLPRSRRAWASWNYRVGVCPSIRPTVTYNMTMLQKLNSRRTFCVTLNDTERISPDKRLATFNYAHPVFTTNRATMQQRHGELVRHRRTSYCGAYWRNGFHEDGVVSALAVCRQFGIPDWTPDCRPKTVLRSELALTDSVALSEAV